MEPAAHRRADAAHAVPTDRPPGVTPWPTVSTIHVTRAVNDAHPRRTADPVCGICGICHSDTERRVDEGLLEAMRDALVHRGPDEGGIVVDGSIGLAMRRLSIIDLAGGHQPLSNEDGTVHLVCNGEIYNHAELRRDLEARGHVFRTLSDAEVALHLYEERGQEFLTALRGMFGLAIWDATRQILTLAVDRFGIKPLYYHAAAEGLVFCSELSPMLAADLIPRDTDHGALAEFFDLGFIAPPTTPFAGTAKLPPAHRLTWRRGESPHVSRYWDLQPCERPYEGSDADLRTTVRERLTESVEAHLVSDVPVGVLLSGGIDSAAITTLARRASATHLRTFTLGFADWSGDERKLARETARRAGTEHVEIVAEPANVDLLPKLADHFGEPFADPAALPTYILTRLAAEHVKVVLSGDGGDEIFLGYTVFRGLQMSRRLSRLPASLRRAGRGAARRLPRTGRTALDDRLAVLGRRSHDSLLSPLDAYRRKLRPVGLADPAGILSPAFGDRVAHAALRDPVADAVLAYGAGDARSLDAFAYAGLKVGLAGGMLVKVDRMSMANSLEVRVPFLDHRLAEFVWSVPTSRRFPHSRLKGLLKDTMADALPEHVLSGRKRGFGVPLTAWFRDDLWRYSSDVLLDGSVRTAGFFDVDAVASLLSKHRSGTVDAGEAIWTLLMFELWRRGPGADLRL
jgi:asparagine synthase (glutamine-hydrolysing)